MTKKQFLDALRARLSELPREDVERALAYYAEMIDDHIESGMTEAEAVAVLGPVDEAAAQSLLGSSAPVMPQVPLEMAPGPDRAAPAAGAPRRGSRRTVVTAAVVVAVAVAAALFFGGVGELIGGLVGGSERAEDKTYEFAEPLRSVEADLVECDIRVMPSEDGRCRVVCREPEKIGSVVEVKNDTLTITRRDERPWYARLGLWRGGELSVTVYLPAGRCGTLALGTVSGDITVAEGFYFSEAALQTTSGDIAFTGRAEAFSAWTVSGDVQAETVTAASAAVSTTSGELRLSVLDADTLDVAATSGDVSCRDVVVAGACTIETVSGGVLLSDSDAGSIRITTVSGNVGATLRSPKAFFARSVSGNVYVPPSEPGAGACTVKTASGDINIGINA